MKNLSEIQDSLLIWDSEGIPPVGDWTTVLWNSFGNNDDSNSISIPKLVEEQAETLREIYLTWIYGLGEARIKGKRLIDHLELRSGFSYWWMTLLAQKFNASGTSQINNAIKVIALEKLISEYKIKSIVLVSDNRKMAVTFQNLCIDLKLRFKWDVVKSNERQRSLGRRIHSYLPYHVQALIYLVWYLYNRILPFRKNRIPAQALNGEICFIDVLTHLDRQAYIKGRFNSNYWTSLVDKLFQCNLKTNWLHNYFHHELIPTIAHAQKSMEFFNKCSLGLQFHALIEASFGPSIIIKALKDYFRISMSSYNLSEISCYFRPAGSKLNLWPLFKHEWIESVRGQSAMLCCLRISLYEKIFSDIPHQKVGVYIQENQPWEMALIYAWKFAGHGKLIGTPHTNVRFWDLRYFYDSRNYNRIGKNVLPMPDMMAVNSSVAKRICLEGGYPETRVTEVEALRFLHLLKLNPLNGTLKFSEKPFKVLVCGDFLSATNDKILSWLSMSAKILPPETSYVLKPHPACSIKIKDFQSLTLQVTETPLPELFKDCHVVFTSNITSAVVDAYYSGIPVIQMLDGKTFNMSPLRGLEGVVYVTNPMELAGALLNSRYIESAEVEPYFYLDGKLQRWMRLLGLKYEDV
ncbi:MAG: TIGR04326 family surface carbohydrate biosynthesis protein [Desulfobacula sp.]